MIIIGHPSLRSVKILQDANDLDLRSGDWQVLDAFHDQESSLAFQGLKRSLGMHQETLSRALHRLESDHLVERTEDGYRLTQRGSEIIHVREQPTKRSKILETYLPSDVSSSDVISRLKYSWFSTLRWLGSSGNNNEVLLTWVTEDGSTQVRARFEGNRLSIEINPDNGENSDLAIKSAHELAARIIREYRMITEQVHNSRTAQIS
jgi:DNA-binding MarR family transcriptional regulator